jgi:D-alanyl-D-alanine carboxypeptidase/D-alanyl-D-alanine-endopeptidase (penicillin-binding protein 4)
MVERQQLQHRVEAKLREAGPGPRFGLLVVTLDGEEVVAIDPDERFIPASNAKILTTAAAFETMKALDAPDLEAGALVRFEPGLSGAPDVVLEGRGDMRLSSAPDCVVNCLAALADAIAARTRTVGSVIGDSRFFPDERWSQGMSWNNIPTSSGTALSALTLDQNEVALRVTPGKVGQLPHVAVSDYYRVENLASTATGGGADLVVTRLPGSHVLRLTGAVEASVGERLIRLGLDDPAHYAAWRFRRMLEERGVRVGGGTLSRHRAAGTALTVTGDIVARLTPQPLAEGVTIINKASQNAYAELLLRRLGTANGTGSAEDGIKVVRSMMERASVPSHAWHLADGSGMSTYNRVSPRGMVTLLRWAAGRPWGAAFRATLPIGGVDGTLVRRFRGTGLKGRVFAKTGSINATNALAGYMLTRSGRTLVFAIYANDVPEEVRATLLMDAALELVASAT